MVDSDNSNSSGNCPDITHLIRSVQRLEGNPDCFGKSDGNCERLDCAWRKLCLKESQKGAFFKGLGAVADIGGDPQK